MGGYGGWGGGVNLGGYSPTAFYPNQIQPVQPVAQPVAAPPVQAGAQGGSTVALQNYLGSIAASTAADQAAQLVFMEWQMATGSERLAMEKAQQEWQRVFSERQQTFSEGVTEAGLLGTYEGQQTQQAQQQQWSQNFNQAQLAQQAALAREAQGQQGALGLLQAQAGLQGPRDWHRYWQMSASAPQGLTSALQSLAGRYQYAPGYQGTPGAATLGSRTQDLLSGGNQGTGAPGAPSTDGQAGNTWQWNLQNYARMSPSMQQGLLGAAEAGGAYGPDLERLLQQAAPRYTGPGAAQIGL